MQGDPSDITGSRPRKVLARDAAAAVEPAGSAKRPARQTGSRLITRFLLIIFASVGIEVGVEMYEGLEKRSALPAQLRTEAMAEARSAAVNLERTFDGARQLLSALANIPTVRDHDQAACAALESIGRGLPMYDYISLRRLDGTLECGAIEAPLNVRADPWLIDKATASGEFVIGFYGRSLVTGNPVIRLGYPVLGRDGAVNGTITAGLSLAWLDATLAEWRLPEGAALDFADLNGVLVARRPGLQEVGHALPPGLKPALSNPDAGAITARGFDGVTRVYGHTVMKLGAAGGVLVALGLDRDAAISAVERSIAQNLQNSLIVLLAAGVLSWLVMRRTVARPIEDLLVTALRWQKGNWTARPSVHSNVREFEALATGFNAMADAVAAREAELKHSEDHLARAQRVAAIGSFQLDFRTDRVVWSDETYRIFGLSPHDGSPSIATIASLVIPEDREAFDKSHAEARAGLESTLREYRIRRRDGAPRTIYREVEAVRDEAGRQVGIIGVVKDVTDLRETERQRDDLQQQLLHAQKMEAIGTLAGGIAHDLNNALLPVIALSTLTMKQLPREDRACQNLQIIHESGMRARNLVRQILDFARKPEPARRRVDLGTLTRSALTLVRSTLPATIAIQDRLEPVPTIWADEAQIHQVLVNLLTNAAQAIGERMGTIAVELTSAASATGAGPASVRVSVTDSGCGMDAATRQRIFEPFFTTKGVGEGTGLGLSVVHGIVTAHRGAISVESTPGRGARFDVVFPAADDEQRAARERAA
jgi:PAS domain S-box-containing protein